MARRQTQYGANTFKRETVSYWRVLGHQFQSSLTYLLLGASILSFFLQDLSDGIVILSILLINALIGFSQEYRSEKTAEKLSALISKHVLVKRDGKNTLIDQRLLVPGDVVILKEGDIVPADITVFQSDNLSVDESQLTGESVPVAKNTEAGATQKGNRLFMGSVIGKGEGNGYVTAIGDNTELGKIAHLSSTTKKVTPYERSLASFSSFLIRFTLLTLTLVLGAKLGLSHSLAQASGYFIFVIALAIAVVPEAMPVISTLTLASGAMKLAKQNVVVKRLSSMEDLGNITILCTDKTGTLTENKLQITGISAEDTLLLQAFAIASTEAVDQKRQQGSSSFDQAFQDYAGTEAKEAATHYQKVKELPFDPADRRRRTILEDTRDHGHYLVDIGSAETLLANSTSPKQADYSKEIQEDGKQGLRHLAISYVKVDYQEPFDILAHEKNLQFLGFAKMADPLRPSTRQTLEEAEKLGVSIKILTGDSKEVAEYVGRQVGLLKDQSRVYTGDEIEKMAPEMLREALSQCNIFARVTPVQKYSIIKMLQETEVVGYQGDGINDAPSLKLADVAIAVNNATDVAKENADILLLRPDLGVIINGIRLGRTTFVNINKYIKYTMVGNFGNFFALAGLFLVSNHLPLLPIQLLLSCLIGDLPLVAISTDNVDDAEVLKPSRYDIRALMLISIVLGVVTMLVEFLFFFLFKLGANPTSETLLFLFLTFIQLAVIASIRTRGYFWKGRKPSWQLIGGIVIVALLSLSIPYIPPLATLFSFAPPSLAQIGSIIGITALYVVVVDVIKVWYYQFSDLHQVPPENNKHRTAVNKRDAVAQ